MTALVTENLSLLASAPNGIKKLRQLILTLAVQGRLVPQDQSEQPAADFLNRIAAHKADAAARGRSRRPLEVPEPMESAAAPVAPAGWLWTTFGSVTVCRDGERIPVSQVDREHRKKLYDYYGASGVIDKIDGYLFDKPLLLIGEDGANLVNRSSPIAFIARGQYWVNNHAHVIDGVTEGLLKYLELYINAIDLKPYVTGTAQPKMNQAKLNAIPLALPPEAEQHRIVAKVDELMALCDRLEAEQADAEAAHAQLVEALLASLTQARDAADFRASWQQLAEHFHTLFTTEASVDALRAAILCLAAEGKLVEEDGNARQLPIGQLLHGDSLNGCSRKPSDDPAGTPILRISAGTGSDDFYVDEADHKWVDANSVEREKFRLLPNDLLACRFNGNLKYVGSFSLYRGTSGAEQIFPDKLIRFRVDPSRVLADYVRYVMNAAPARKQIEAFCATTVGNIGISATNLKTVELRVPSLNEQRRIVDKLTHLFSLCDQLKADLAAVRLHHVCLASVLVEQAVA